MSTPSKDSPKDGPERPGLLGSISGGRTVSGTITGLEAKGSFDDMALQQRHTFSEESQRERAHTADAGIAVAEEGPPVRKRLYSEEDEDLRLAKAMALAVQQHPDMTPDQVHAMHIGDVQQSQIVQDQKPKSSSSTFKGLDTFRAKAKEKFQGMVKTDAFEKPKAIKERLQGMGTPKAASEPFSPTKSSSSSSSSATKSSTVLPSAVAKTVAQQKKTPTAPTPKAVMTKTATTSKTVAQKAATTARTAAQKTPVPTPMSAAEASHSVAVTTKEKAALASASDKTAATSGDRGGSAPPRSMSPLPSGVPRSSSTPVTPPQIGSSSGSWDEEGKKEKKSKLPGMLYTLGLAEKPPQFDETEKVRLSAIVWKRRSGLGKLSVTKAWERRKIILQGSKLFYFVMAQDMEETGTETPKKATWLEQAGNWMPASDDPSTPRGYLDLVKERATVAAATGHSGAPSPFAISIKIKADTYWKLCFDTHATQMEWLAALTDLVVNASVDAYNANLLAAADPSHDPTIFSGHYLPPPGGGVERDSSTHRLWMMQPYNVSGSSDDVYLHKRAEKEIVISEEVTVATTTSSASGDTGDVDRWILRQREVCAIVAIVNVALVYSRSSSTSTEGFWYIVTFANLGVWLCLAKEYRKKSSAAAMLAVEPGAIKKGRIVPVEPEKEEVPKFKPLAGTTTVKIKETTDTPSVGEHIFGGWRAVSGETLAIRSHGYLTTKKKVPSPGELYECVNVDIFESPRRYPDMAKRVTLPKVKFEGEDPVPKTWHSPDIFIVSVSLPTDPPKMRGSSDDGGGYTVTMYFAMRQETRDILRRVTADDYDPLEEPKPEDVQKGKVNAVKLFDAWCHRAPTDPDFQSRFKLVANSQNLKEIGIPSWIAKYNGKPVLIKRPGQTGFLYPHPELSCVEFDISFFPFPYLAKQGICYLKENFFKKVLVTFGFVIEGRSDDELPECIIGLMQLCYPDPQYAIQGADFFSGKSPKSF